MNEAKQAVVSSNKATNLLFSFQPIKQQQQQQLQQ